MPEEQLNSLGTPTTAAEVQQMADGVFRLLSDLFTDDQPEDEDGQRSVFRLAGAFQRDDADMDEIEMVLRDTYLNISDRPRAQWDIEIGYDEVARIAQAVVESNERPATQIIDRFSLEFMIRDETRHSILLPPKGSAGIEFEIDGQHFAATAGLPSVDLLVRCALKRDGFQALAVFNRELLYRYLQDQETRRSLPHGAEARISALRLLKIMAEPSLRSLRIRSEYPAASEELERAATAYRVRMAYEASIVYVPVLDVNRLDATPAQPEIVRQLHARAEEFVQAIGERRATGFMGDQLIGHPSPVEEETALRYLRAVAAHDPFAAFMGYYHILENVMNQMWLDDLKSRVAAAGATLTEQDVKRAGSQAAKFLGANASDLSYTELRALRVVIGTMEVGDFTRDLARYVDGSLEYFATGTVPFVEVEPLDFAAATNARAKSELSAKIADRIYAVRCAITHSKASTKRYSPYTDDLYLGREVPLVRIAAEQMLIPGESRI